MAKAVVLFHVSSLILTTSDPFIVPFHLHQLPTPADKVRRHPYQSRIVGRNSYSIIPEVTKSPFEDGEQK